MEWSRDEIAYAERLARDVEACGVSRTTRLAFSSISLRYSDARSLLERLSRKVAPTLMICQLFHALNFDEHNISRWRMEHKLVQALLLHRYCPDSIPVTHGFTRELATINGSRAPVLPERSLVKAALSEASGERGIDHLKKAIAELPFSSVPIPVTPCEESYILQEKLTIVAEYRVHSMEGKVVPDMTLLRYEPDAVLPEVASRVNAFVQGILDRLPNGLVSSTMYAWDIALKEDARFVVIEANPAGYHPVFQPGFQCSGFFQSRAHGAALVAKLLRFVSDQYGVSVSVEVPYVPDSEAEFYWWVAQWMKLIDAVNSVRTQYRRHNWTPPPTDSPDIDFKLSGGQNAFVWALAELNALRKCVERV